MNEFSLRLTTEPEWKRNRYLNEKSPTVLSFISHFFGYFFLLLLVIYQHTVREINGNNNATTQHCWILRCRLVPFLILILLLSLNLFPESEATRQMYLFVQIMRFFYIYLMFTTTSCTKYVENWKKIEIESWKIFALTLGCLENRFIFNDFIRECLGGKWKGSWLKDFHHFPNIYKKMYFDFPPPRVLSW